MDNSKLKSVYVASHEFTTLTKVGISIDASKRMDTIKNAVGAKMQVYYESNPLTNAVQIETDILTHFEDFRIEGEWLNIEPQKVIEYIKTIESKFNGIDFKCLHCDFENYIGEQITQLAVFKTTQKEVSFFSIVSESDGVYITKDFKFIVFYHQRDKIYTVQFNIYKTARKFIMENNKRITKLNDNFTELLLNNNFK